MRSWKNHTRMKELLTKNVEDIETSKNPTEKDTTTDEDDSDLKPIPNEEVAATSTNTLPEASVLPGRDAATQTKEQRAEENEMLMREDPQKSLPWMDKMMKPKRFLPL